MSGKEMDPTLNRIIEGLDNGVNEALHRVGEVENSVQRVSDQVGEVEGAVSGLADVVQDLVNRDQQAKPKKPPFSWLTNTDKNEQDDVLSRLENFVNMILVHFPDGILADCWRRHPHVVEELIVLADGHELAWAPGAPISTRFDWLNRWLPETMKRIGQALNICSLGHERHTDQTKFVPAVQVGLDDFSDFDTTWRRSHGLTIIPPPTDEALIESRERLNRKGMVDYARPRR